MVTDLQHDSHDALWTAALLLPGQPDLLTSLVTELADYLEQPVDRVAERCRTAAAELAQHWRTTAPGNAAAITAFYRQADTYLYDLTWWHALQADTSALIQVQALEAALAHHAHTVLDFGSGIGSLGLLLAQHGMAVTLADVQPDLNAYARWRFARRNLPAQVLDLPATTASATDPASPSPTLLPSAAFDFISAVDVLEHLPDPLHTLAQLTTALRPGGTLFIHLPPAADALYYPMHLWHDPNLLLREAAQLGLWLEQAAGSTLIMRRGTGPRYQLAAGLELRRDTQGAILLSTQPLVAMRLNAQAAKMIASLTDNAGRDGGHTAAELAAGHPELALVDVTTFLETLLQRRLLVRHPPALTHWPMVSIIIPAYGRAEATRACIASLLALDYPREQLEIIVVDDASQPPLAGALADLPIRLLRQEQNAGQSVARNRAAQTARGALLAFIDNDCRADQHWLQRLVAVLDDPTVGIAGGRVIAPPVNGPVAAFEAVRSPLDMGATAGVVGPGSVISYMPTCNLVVRRDLLMRLQGFDPAMTLGEDVDFIWRALRTGVGARYVPTAQVIHYHRVQLSALLRRRADYGSSEADLQRRHPEGRRVMALPLVSLLVLLALTGLGIAWGVSAVLLLVAAVAVVLEIAQKTRQIRRVGVDLPAHQVRRAILLEHGASLYHLGANVARYYSLPLLLVGLLWPPLLLPLLLLLLVPPITDYRRLRPQLALPLFIVLYWLELAAYQVGVWRGCWQQRTLRPLLPLVRWRR